MKKYSKGNEMKLKPARNQAANDGDGIVRRETNNGPPNLQNKSILRIVAFISTNKPKTIEDTLLRSIFRD
jgi:hypothetical protein